MEAELAAPGRTGRRTRRRGRTTGRPDPRRRGRLGVRCTGPSYRLLQPDAARLYRLLGWLPIGVFDAGVAAVAAGIDTRSVKRLLAVLAKASLAEAVGDGRYRMHDLVRLHARERAAEEEPETEHSWAKTTVTRLSPRRSGGSVSSTRTVEVTVRAATTRVRSPRKVLQRWASRPTGTRSGRLPNNSAASDEPASQPVSGSRRWCW